jgi:hypothetical protein
VRPWYPGTPGDSRDGEFFCHAGTSQYARYTIAEQSFYATQQVPIVEFEHYNEI